MHPSITSFVSTQVSPQERQGARGKREKRVLVTKKLDESSSEGPPLKFVVIDNPVWLQEHEWDSVVAVFSNGKAWQFSDWKYAQPVDLFHRCACHATTCLSVCGLRHALLLTTRPHTH